MLEAFASLDAAAEAAAHAIAAQLRPPGPRRMVATGGRTPGPVYDRLAKVDLDWSRVTVTLSDERFVDPSSHDSNERLVRDRLLKDHAAGAQFAPLKGKGAGPMVDAAAAEPRIRALLPFDVVMLGMGEDGHVGSMFPGMQDLAAALNPAGRRLVIGVAKAPDPPQLPRISLTAAAMLDSRLIVIFATGAEKRTVIERVAAEPAYSPPVATLLRQTGTPVRAIWSP